jgi:hypothetical protein
LYGGGTYMMMLFVSDIILGLIFKINCNNSRSVFMAKPFCHHCIIFGFATACLLKSGCGFYG